MNSRFLYNCARVAVLCAALGLVAGCNDVATTELKTPVYKTKLNKDEIKNSA